MLEPRGRRSYASDATLRDRVFDLLDTWLPELRERRRRAEALRWRWEDCSTPFVKERDGRVIAHVGVLETQLVTRGQPLLVGGIHAVCTLASERRRGLYRELMREALTYCDERYEAVKLCTENPEYYEPFGFRVVPEHRFRVRVDSEAGRPGFRPLVLSQASEIELLEELLAARYPVSQVLGVVRGEDVFKFNQAYGGLYYCEELAVIAAMRRSERNLEIDDLVAGDLPDLEGLLARIGDPVDEVVFHFRPDRLGIEATPEPHRHDGDVLMVRGRFPAESEALEFMLPPPARH